MNILGVEITFPQIRAASPSPVSAAITIPSDLQETKPSLSLDRSHPGVPLGDSGTRLLHGIITDEYNPQLQGVQGINVYEEMRKSDGTVRAAVLACTLPIRRADWFIKSAGGDKEADKKRNDEIRDFVDKALFELIENVTWDDIIRQALLMVSFGVMLFEKVYNVQEIDGKEYVVLQKLAPRLPKSIMQWELVDGTFGIQQIRQDGQVAQIPGNKMLIFVNEREGDNWWGMSMLRAAYKHWYHKNNFYKIDGIAFERQGLGVPVMKMPKGYTANDEKKAVTALKNMRANESAYLILPPDYDFSFADMGSKTTRDPENSINHHNKEILQSVLAQFLELGQTKAASGSRALSQDHSDLFLKAMEAIANTFRDVINKDLIPELVDMNFNDVKTYPVLDYSGISKVDIAGMGQAISQLVTAGGIHLNDDDEQWIRAAFGMPERTQEQIDEDAEDEPTPEDLETGVDVDDDPNADAPDVEDEAEAAAPAAQTPAQKKKTQTASKTPAAKKTTPPTEATERRLVPTFDDGSGFKSWRPLTMAEQKVSWKRIQDMMDKMEADFTDQAKELLTQSKDSFMAKLHDAIDKGDQQAVAALELQFVSQYQTLLQSAMKKAYEYGKDNVSTEMGVASPANNADSLATMRLLAQTIAEKTASDIATKAKVAAAGALKNDTPPLQAAGAIDSSLDAAIDTSIQQTAATIIGQNINVGRNDVFERNSAMIYALQRSEILDAKTCNFCLSMDGKVIDPGDDAASWDTFHSNCRGLWVEILNDESNPPDITGIPSEISDYYGGQTNALLQPPKPIVEPGSAADKELKKREARKQK